MSANLRLVTAVVGKRLLHADSEIVPEICMHADRVDTRVQF